MADSWGYKDKAKTWKSEIRKKFPRCKVSVTIKHFDNICIALLSGDFQMYADNFTGNRKGYKQLNPFSFINGRDKSLSDEMNEFWSYVDKVGRKILGNQTNPDHNPMIDYHSVNYYLNYEIGKWNQPYVCINETKSAKINKIANRIAENIVFADSDYIYDPDHKKKPSGGYHKTEKGWSKKEEKKEKSTAINSKYNKNYFDNTPAYDNAFVNMAWSDNASDDFYENVLKYGKEGHKWEIANSYKTPSHILDKLATDKSDVVRFKAIQNDNTSTETLTKVYNAEYKKNKNNSDFFEEIGKHKNTSPEILSRLRSNPNKEVRRSVAGNPNTLPEDLDVLAHYNNDRIILMNVAGNESANEDTLTYLFNSYHNKDVRGELATNDNCPLDIVKTLAKSKDSYVRAGAQGNLERRKRKEQDSATSNFDLSKLSPEMREKVKDWDAEDIKKFLGWLKENKN